MFGYVHLNVNYGRKSQKRKVVILNRCFKKINEKTPLLGSLIRFISTKDYPISYQ
jgi:hypothetical protein